MKRLLPIITLIVIGLTACNNNAKTEKDIDSINQAMADSLLNDALQDTVKQDTQDTDSLTKDSK